MPFYYYYNNNITMGDISIIPNEYKEEALQQKNNAIYCHNLGYFNPPVVVDIGKSIQYIV